jgi:hypothetical protein
LFKFDILTVYTPLYAIADEGKDWAQYQLGCRYLKGIAGGFDMNFPEGVRYIQMAAEKGYMPQLNVAWEICIGKVKGLLKMGHVISLVSTGSHSRICGSSIQSG